MATLALGLNTPLHQRSSQDLHAFEDPAVTGYLNVVCSRFSQVNYEYKTRRRKIKSRASFETWCVAAFCASVTAIDYEFVQLEEQLAATNPSLVPSFRDLGAEHVRSLWNQSAHRELLLVYLQQQFSIFAAGGRTPAALLNKSVIFADPQTLSTEIICPKLRRLGLEGHLHFAASEHILSAVDEWMRGEYANDFEQPVLETCLAWVNDVVMEWLETLGLTDRLQRRQWKARLVYHVHDVLGSMRISSLFDIIIEFPSSTPAVHDLKICMNKTGNKASLIESLSRAISKRALQPGAETHDILVTYTSCIKCLRILDSSDHLLEKVTHKMRSYLRGRDDTIRGILAMAVDDATSADLMMMDEALVESSADDEYWMPLPKDADADQPIKVSDVFTKLVNIYDSQTVFVKEFQSMLAAKLLSLHSYDVDKEEKNLELLKSKFGETSLQSCEVMIKDVYDSKRIDAQYQNSVGQTSEVPMRGLIVSRSFWPQVRAETFALPEPVERTLKEYQQTFVSVKQGRTLDWLPQLGSVTLELEFGDRALEFNVSPIHASIIMFFDDRESVTLEEMMYAFQMPVGSLRRAIAFWINAGVVSETSPDVYTVVEDIPDVAVTAMQSDSMIISGAEADAEEWKKYWLVISGLLQNLGVQPFHRIESNMSMFVEGYEKTPEELKVFLEKMVGEGKLEVESGGYRFVSM